ncbi:L-threonylcarbamoyladenylate synthase [Draconibacterium sp. IB214405]|uniref:L-threonylcarbamoyladenylate synthase n=1 Tax=Draconibacterium sp. IB214405 TaxID=3097352 RepID=UPI002A1404C5|nr:L-threonylcarbamoyladenylate synthase [Draconibacterium sp. IB214405]MDX8340157.1 L-threonylcarbamoyladenylate synthase [Draconibacterium sp. IB214405]
MNSIINDTKLAASIIQNGELVAFPTETVYGLGADAFNPEAVAKIFATKERPTFNPLIVHIHEISELEKLFVEIDDALLKLAEHFWPGPLTIVAKKQKSVPDIVSAGLDTVAVRMPANQTARELLKLSGKCIAAPSANRFGMLSPTTPEHVQKQLPQLNCILNGELPKVGIESTVIELSNGEFKILRPGFITEQDLLKVLPQSKTKEANSPIKSPGQLKSHYSPRKPMYLLGNEPEYLENKKYGFLAFSKVKEPEKYHLIERLSDNKDLGEAAAKFFEALHRLEDSDVDLIIAEPIPEVGIGIAIMDRLKKAVYQYRDK